MPETKKNALAELAENLEHENFFGVDHYKRELWVYKAQRIVTELAKVEDQRDGETNSDVLWRCNDCIARCRAIAEEGKVRDDE